METDRYTIDESGVLVVKPGVTAILDSEFKNNVTITKAVLPRTVHAIEHSAFHGCKRLKSINIPQGVRFIKFWSFADCESLTAIDIPEGVISIETNAFYKCTKLRTVNLPSTLKTIEDEAFSTCTSLKQIVVPDGAEMICKRMFGYSWSPFKYCDALKKVIIRDIKPRVSKTEVKKIVLIEQSQYHRLGRLYGAIIGVQPGEEFVEYARETIKQLLWDSFKYSGLYMDYEDYGFRDMPPVNEVLEYGKQRLAILDLPEGASPSTIQVGTNTYLTDEVFFKSLVEGSVIEWMPLVEKGK